MQLVYRVLRLEDLNHTSLTLSQLRQEGYVPVGAPQRLKVNNRYLFFQLVILERLRVRIFGRTDRDWQNWVNIDKTIQTYTPEDLSYAVTEELLQSNYAWGIKNGPVLTRIQGSVLFEQKMISRRKISFG